MSYRAFGAQKFYLSIAKNVRSTFFAMDKKKCLRRRRECGRDKLNRDGDGKQTHSQSIEKKFEGEKQCK
jgi:hypothetical protein